MFKTILSVKTQKKIISKRFLIRLLCVPFLLVSTLTQAEEEKKNPFEKTMKVKLPKDSHFIYVGAGLTNKLFHVVLEKPTQYGNFYGKVGRFNEGNGVAGQVGYRYPYKFTNKKGRVSDNNNGIYVGLFGGHVMSIRDKNIKKDDKRFNRLGGGFDISYLWFDKQRISALSLGVFLPEKNKLKNGDEVKVKPELMLGLSLSAGLF